MVTERERFSEIRASPDIEIIGKGSIGEKAGQLVKKTNVLKEMGFYVPKRTVLAQDFFDGFFQRNGLGNSLTDVNPDPDLEAKIEQGKFSEKEIETLQGIFSSNGNKPLVLRSSGEGDARGTGIYKSEFSENKSEDAIVALKKVLASYFSKNAITFRRDAKIGEGFGVIVEPLIGQDMGGFFGPILSGFGYTSTSVGEGYVNIVPGIGGGVETRDGERVTKSSLLPFQGNLSSYRIDRRSRMFDGEIPLRRSSFLGTDRNRGGLDDYSAIMYIPTTEYRKAVVNSAGINLYDGDRERWQSFSDLNLLPFFDKLDEMEKLFKKPQYFEWAMTIENKTPKFWIIQIADVDRKLDLMDFEKFGKPLLEGHTVTGTGTAECEKLVYCPNRSAIDSLHKFNQENKNYLVVYSSQCTKSYLSDNYLSYEDMNNASVLMEDQEEIHANDQSNPLGHLHGRLDMTRKLFGVINRTEDINTDWLNFLKRGEKYDSSDLMIFEGKLKIISSERQNRIVVYLQE